MPINKRIKQVRDKYFNKSTKDFSEALGISSQAVSNYMRDGYSVGKDVIGNILKVAPLISMEWLSYGVGEMLKDNSSESPIKSYTQGVPYYNVDFIGGFDLVMNEQTLTPEYLIDLKKYNGADCWCNVTRDYAW